MTFVWEKNWASGHHLRVWNSVGLTPTGGTGRDICLARNWAIGHHLRVWNSVGLTPTGGTRRDICLERNWAIGHHLRVLNSGEKVICTIVQALRLCTGRTAHRESRGIALLFHDQRH